MPPFEHPVLIIGAGVAGLALAQGLRLRGVQDAIIFDKQFDLYEVEDNGLVQAQFTDGLVARGQVLVGADGIKNRVRELVQLDRKLLDLERWSMWSRTPLTDEFKENLDPLDILSWCTCLTMSADLPRLLTGNCDLESIEEAFEARMAARAKDKIQHSFRGGEKFWRGKAWNLYSESTV